MKTGAELKARREELKITQQDLAGEIGVSRTQLSRMENGKIKINNYIRTKIEAILTNSEEYKESELTINDIQVGDELICFDRDGFYSNNKPSHQNVIPMTKITVIGVSGDFIEIDNNHILSCKSFHADNLKYFRKKPKLQFSDLEVGDYVYVRDDLVEHQEYGYNSYVSEIGNGIQQIKSFHSEYSQFRTNKSHYWVTPEMLDLSRSMKKEDYLKMNETKKNESFYELQEVAFQAYKDGLINSVAFENKLAPSLIRIDGNVIFDQHVSYKHDIDRIKSLYTEEFVIEKMADELKIKSGAQLILSNGMKCIYFDDGDRKLRHDDDFYPCNFLVLKGATVKQSK